jgi:hypothetical protein
VPEFRSIKALTAADQSLTAGALGSKPLVVLTRGPGSSAVVPEDWRRWHGLHAELARLSVNSRHVIASQSGHYIHKSEPGLVTTSIRDVLHSVRSGTLWPEWRLAGPRSRRRPGRLDRARNVNVTPPAVLRVLRWRRWLELIILPLTAR